jgi:hypothetical protein
MLRAPRGVAGASLCLLAATLRTDASALRHAQGPLRLGAPSGLQLLVDEDNTAPTLRVVLPGRPASDRSIMVLLPEHVTAVRRGDAEGRHLYRWGPGTRGDRPAWRRVRTSLEYDRELHGPVHFVARATLDSDGVRFRHEFHNRSAAAYDLVYAVTDPRLTSMFHDVRLERTCVHFATGLAFQA